MKNFKTKYVPCNGCVLCCRGDLIRLTAEDNPAFYKTEQHPRIPGTLMLAHKENGDCIYLEENDCRIHGRAPELCRVADCRVIALKYDFHTAMQMHNSGLINILVWDKGNDLLDEMKKHK